MGGFFDLYRGIMGWWGSVATPEPSVFIDGIRIDVPARVHALSVVARVTFVDVPKPPAGG